jgi:hypothetical protein
MEKDTKSKVRFQHILSAATFALYVKLGWYILAGAVFLFGIWWSVRLGNMDDQKS